MGNICQPPVLGDRDGDKDGDKDGDTVEEKDSARNGAAIRGATPETGDSAEGSRRLDSTRLRGISGAPSDRSGQSVSSGSSSTITHSLHTKLTRDHSDRDVYKCYEVLEVLGVGSMGSVSLVRKRKEAIGGSARKPPQRSHKTHPQSRSLRNFGGLLGGDNFLKQPLFGFGRRQDALQVFSTVNSKSESALRGGFHRSDSAISTTSRSSVPSDQNYECVYALKSIHLQRIADPKFLAELRNEIDILKHLDHPNIVRAIETFEHRRQLCIVMELCSGGDLYCRDPYTEVQARNIVKKLLNAVAYMHRCGVTHRDIKYENIMFENVSDEAEVKLVDFGLSKKYLPEAPHMYDGVGTIYTMAPQVLEGVYTSKADLWSVGVVAFMLLSSQMPFYGRKRRHVFERIMKCHYSFKGKRWDEISPEAKEMVSSLLIKDQESRASAEEALKSKWFSDSFLLKHPRSETKDKRMLERVQKNMEKFADYSKIKKIALMIVAHKSTANEIGELRNAFEKYDVENNGTISYAEFRLALNDFGYSEDELKKMFRGVDLDGSGNIHYTEFLAATLEANGIIVEERLAEAFDRIDSDDSGFISKENLRSLLTDGFEGRKLSESLIKEIMDEADFRKDGLIAYDEFLSLWDTKEEDTNKTVRDSLIVKTFPSNMSGLPEDSMRSSGSLGSSNSSN